MVGVGSLAGYIGEAMDGPPFSLAFVMVKESFVVPAIFFYGYSVAPKYEFVLRSKGMVNSLTPKSVPAGAKKNHKK
jgi:hypothetical protein